MQIHEKLFHSEKVTIWYGVSTSDVIGPYFFEKNQLGHYHGFWVLLHYAANIFVCGTAKDEAKSEKYIVAYGLLLSNNHETNETTAIASQRPGRHNGSTVGIGVFCVVRSMSISRNWLSSVSLWRVGWWVSTVQWSELVDEWVN
jgi:hypothetical protein